MSERKGTRTVQLRFFMELETNQTGICDYLHSYFPKHSIPKFHLDVSIYGWDIAGISPHFVSKSLQNLLFTYDDSKNVSVVSFYAEDFVLSQGLHLSFPSQKGIQKIVKKESDGIFFCLNDPSHKVIPQSMDLSNPLIILLWDASRSRKLQDKSLEFNLLSKLLSRFVQAEIYLILFRTIFLNFY
jgi:hypothetical protein